MREFIKTIYLFILGGTIYVCSELLFRGRTHWTMFILGGICFCSIGYLNEGGCRDVPLLAQMFSGMAIITGYELIAGLILNVKLGLGIWDYSNMPCNIMGQICLPFSALWFLVSGIAVVVDDYARYLLFGEDRPTYHPFSTGSKITNDDEWEEPEKAEETEEPEELNLPRTPGKMSILGLIDTYASLVEDQDRVIGQLSDIIMQEEGMIEMFIQEYGATAENRSLDLKKTELQKSIAEYKTLMRQLQP